MADLQVIIPIAGLGTRLRPHTHIRPKPLLTVAGKTILDHIMDQLHGLPITEVLFITGHLGEQIKKWAVDSCPFPARFVEQTELRGQAHAISLAREMLNQPTLIIFGDTIFVADLTRLGEDGEEGRLYVQEVSDPRRFGIAVMRDKYVERLVEKPPEFIGNLAVVGIYYVKDAAGLLKAIDQVIERDLHIGGEFYLADALQSMINSGSKFRTSPVDVWADCGTVDAILETNGFLLANGHASESPVALRSTIIPPVWIDPSAIIEDSTVGPHVSLEANVTIRRSTISDSIVNREANIEDSNVDHSLIGRRAVVRGHKGTLNISDDALVGAQS